jgi:hypothetical protein
VRKAAAKIDILLKCDAVDLQIQSFSQ